MWALDTVLEEVFVVQVSCISIAECCSYLQIDCSYVGDIYAFSGFGKLLFKNFSLKLLCTAEDKT